MTIKNGRFRRRPEYNEGMRLPRTLRVLAMTKEVSKHILAAVAELVLSESEVLPCLARPEPSQ